MPLAHVVCVSEMRRSVGGARVIRAEKKTVKHAEPAMFQLAFTPIDGGMAYADD